MSLISLSGHEIKNRHPQQLIIKKKSLHLKNEKKPKKKPATLKLPFIIKS